MIYRKHSIPRKTKRNIKKYLVGSEDGTFRLINLKKDEILLKLNHAKPITALDCQTERPIVACGLSDGSVSVWDLEEMSLITQISAHTSSVNSLTYLPQEDSFVSIGSDNAIKVYVENKVFIFETTFYFSRNFFLNI